MSFTNIIVPYRNRKEHLDRFLSDFVPRLQRLIPNLRVTIVEQSIDDQLFNRGKLLNIGVLESCGDDVSDIIFHDVDIFANAECIHNLYAGKHDDEIIRIYNGNDNSLGGICRFTRDVMFTINGHPNSIFGWGIEDRALYWRAKIKNVKISKHHRAAYSFTSQPHKSNNIRYTGEKAKISEIWTHDNIHKLSAREKNDLVDSDGLNDVSYSILSRRSYQKCVTHLVAKI